MSRFVTRPAALEVSEDTDESFVFADATPISGVISEKPSKAAPIPADANPAWSHRLTAKFSDRRVCRDFLRDN
ncbi:hypothetical protein [Mycobacterium sp. DL]|uniref:hypothetical protein n=1 Tax=Mycobacteriaceae TaxID=1762 RepID=UPI00321A7274